jgi:hypothetical protein
LLNCVTEIVQVTESFLWGSMLASPEIEDPVTIASEKESLILH